MRTILRSIGICVSLAFPSLLAAQATPEYHPQTLNHAEVGIFADYFRFAPAGSTTNYVGTGARASFNVSTNTAIEGEMSYDFARNFTTTFHNGASTTFVTTSVRPLTGLFGPRFQFGGGGPFRVFATGKVGFIDFSTSNSGTVSGTTFSNAVAGVGNPGTHFAFYPGGGFETFFGPIGIRAEAGDEIYLNNGTYNNLRIEAGPTFRF
jgi:hypothetical protein